MPPRPNRQSSSVNRWIHASCRQQPLAERTVLELSRRIQRWQQHPDGPDHAPKAIRKSALRARDRLVSHNLRLVPHIWQRHRHSLPPGDECTADAFQEAALHLMRAAEKFDPTKGYSFSTYATYWVRCGFGEVERRGKRTIRFPYDKARLVFKALRISEQHLCTSGEQLSLAELAEQVKVDGRPIGEAALRELLQQWAITITESLDAGQPIREDADLLGRIDQASLQLLAEQDAEARQRADCEDVLPLLLEQLEPQEQRLIRNRYLRRPPLTPHQLRRTMAMEPEAMAQLEQRALAKLRCAAAALQADQAA